MFQRRPADTVLSTDFGETSSGAREGKLHRALADGNRARMVDELRRTPNGLDVQELAERVGLHPNTIRWHLAILADAGIVRSRTGERGRPGRPRIVYTLSDDTDAGDAGSYRLLATMLTGALGDVRDGVVRAEATGSAWGRYLVERPAPHVRPDDGAALRRVVELLAEQGFRPRAEGDEIRMHHCPYRELAPGLVCAAHRGLISGALQELGSSLEVESLDPFVEPELCVARLRRRT